MDRYIKELEGIYKKNILKSDKELDSIKALIRNSYRSGFTEGYENALKQLTKLEKL